MNNWIERNIIFPKINEIKMKEAKMKEQIALKTSILKLLSRKDNSPHRLQETDDRPARQNYSIRRRKQSTIKKKNTIFQPYTLEQTNRETEAESVRAENHIISLDLFNQRKSQFHSAPVKKISTRLPTTGRQIVLNNMAQASLNNITKLKKSIKKSRSKLKTDPAQQRYKQNQLRKMQQKECFSIKKAPAYNYNSLQKIEERSKQIKHVSKPKPKPFQDFKQTSPKITSIKGWNFDHEQAIQFL